jgi:protein-tyrosine phosphatase
MEMVSQAARLGLSGCHNVRDLGGFDTPYGPTAPGVLVRADDLHHLDAEGIAALPAAGIRTIVDLRADEELTRYASPFAGSTDPVYLNVPIRIDDPGIFQGWPPPPFVDAHVRLLDWVGRSIGDVVTAIARAEPPVLFHCHLGKDRTGLIAGILLALAGADDVDIAADYALSDDNLGAAYQVYLDQYPEAGPVRTLVERQLSCKPDWMRGMLVELRERWGGAEAYLTSRGVSQADISALRQRLVPGYPPAGGAG